MTAFPEEYKLLVPNLLIETMSMISTSFVARIDGALGEASFGIRTLTGGAYLNYCILFWFSCLLIGHI
jgi:hypothetical protein